MIAALIALTGCRFSADSDILAGQPGLPLETVFQNLQATRFAEVGGTRSASVERNDDGSLEITLFKDSARDRSLTVSAIYPVPGPMGAVLAAETQKSGRVSYTLLRPRDDGSVVYLDVDAATYNDPRVLLYRAHLWSVGIPQRLKIISFSDESGLFRPVAQSAAEFDAALAARQQEQAEAARRAERQSCLRMLGECHLASTVCTQSGDGVVINSLDGTFWYSADTGEFRGLSGVGLLNSGRPNCALQKLVE